MKNLMKIINEKIKKIKKKFDIDTVCDLLILTSFLVVFITTLTLNVYIAFYLLAMALFILAIVLFKIN